MLGNKLFSSSITLQLTLTVVNSSGTLFRALNFLRCTQRHIMTKHSGILPDTTHV